MVRKIPTLALSAALFGMSGSTMALPVGADSAGLASPGLGSASLRTPLTARSPTFPRTPKSANLNRRGPADADGISRCASHLSEEELARAEQHFQDNKRPASGFRLAQSPAPLNVNFHVIYVNETIEGGYVPDEQLNAQVDVLNKAYSNTGLSWKLANVTRTQNENWFLKAGPEEEEQTEMKEALRTGSVSDLNVYTVGFEEGSGEGLLGYATFPVDYENNPTDDGVVMKFSTLPNGTMSKFNLGHTLTHEAGHWAGLLHTFTGGCSGDGDGVDDTAPERSAASGCPVGRSTCPGGEPDPINDYMDYSDDACMTGFTDGQATRIQEQMRTYRELKI